VTNPRATPPCASLPCHLPRCLAPQDLQRRERILKIWQKRGIICRSTLLVSLRSWGRRRAGAQRRTAPARILKRMQPRKKNSTEMTQKKTRQHVRCLRNGRAAWFFFVSSRFVGILVASFSRFGLVNYVQLCFSHLVLNFFFWWVVSFPRFGRRRLWAREGWFC